MNVRQAVFLMRRISGCFHHVHRKAEAVGGDGEGTGRSDGRRFDRGKSNMGKWGKEAKA